MTERDFPDRGQPARPDEVVHPDPVPDETPGIEEPEADFIEQHLRNDEEDDSEQLSPAEEIPVDANEADVVEQRTTTPPLDEDYP
jgi:hypothetical protein